MSTAFQLFFKASGAGPTTCKQLAADLAARYRKVMEGRRAPCFAGGEIGTRGGGALFAVVTGVVIPFGGGWKEEQQMVCRCRIQKEMERQTLERELEARSKFRDSQRDVMQRHAAVKRESKTRSRQTETRCCLVQS